MSLIKTIWDPDDDFTGADGSAPDTTRWTKEDSSGSVSIQSNQLNFAVSSPVSITSSYLTSNWYLTGDFDIQIDINVNTGNTTSPASGYQWAGYMRLIDISPFIAYRIPAYEGGSYRIYDEDDPDPFQSSSIYSYPDGVNGKLRLVRSGSTITGYFWNSSASRWDWDGAGNGYTFTTTDSGDTRVRLQWRCEDGEDLDSSFDNFTINSADGIIPPRLILPDDDFTALDGSSPNTTRWYETDASNKMDIQSNKLDFDSQEGTDTSAYINSKYELSGDFDIQVDFDVVDAGDTTSGQHSIRLQIADGGSPWSGSYCEVIVSRTSNSWWNVNNDGVWADSFTRSVSSGKLRLTRSGSTIKGYVWTGSQWEWDGSTSGYTFAESHTNDVLVTLYTNQESSGGSRWHVTLDNFTVNSADGITPTDTFTLSEDSVGIKSPAWLDWIDPDDDFTGTDGDPPDTDRWTETDASNKMSIVSNALDFDSSEAADTTSYIESTFNLSGDFDIQVDFDIADYGNPSSGFHYIRLHVADGGGYEAGNFCEIMAARQSSTSYWVVNGNVTAFTSVSRSVDSGKFRIVRSGSTITGYIWNASLSRWEWNGSTSGFTFSESHTNDLCVVLYSRQEGDGSTRWHVTFDNFQVNSADGLTMDDAPTQWAYRYPITIDSSKVDSDLTDFPILVHLGDSSGAGNKDVTSVFSELAPPSSVDDDFTGADGNAPDPDLWVETDDSNKMQIVSNALDFDSSESADVTSNITSVFHLTGDFDIQIDATVESVVSPGTARHYALFWIKETSTGSPNSWMNLTREDDGNDYFDCGGSSTASDNHARTTDTTKFRFTRSGSTITGYYWSGAQWEWDGSTSGKTFSESFSDDVEISAWFKQEGTGSARWHVTFDNFTVNSGSVVWPASTFPYRKKIALADIDGTSQLYTEIEKWATFSGTTTGDSAWLWTKVPTVSSGVDTIFYLYYDNTNNFLDNNTYIGDTGDTAAQNVWNSDYAAVYHMNGSSDSEIYDSTSNGEDATSDNGDPTYEQVGKIGYSVYFDGNGDSIQLPTVLTTETSFTFQALCYPETPSDSDKPKEQMLVQFGDDNAAPRTMLICRDQDEDDTDVLFQLTAVDSGWDSSGEKTAETYSINDWYMVTGVRSGDLVYTYVNADSRVSDTHVGLGDSINSQTGAIGRADSADSYFSGKICEVRISSTDRSASWAKADYYSIFDTLTTFGTLDTTVLSLHFSSPYPVHLSTVYGLSHYLKIIVTASGVPDPSIYSIDVDFYDGESNQIGSTVSGTNSGEQTTSSGVLTTTSGGTYNWYVYAASGDINNTSSIYTFTNKFLCQGTTTVNGTGTSGIPVRLYKRDDGSLVGSTTSAGVSGTFSIESDYNEYHYAVAIHPTSSGTNALIYDYLRPGE